MARGVAVTVGSSMGVWVWLALGWLGLSGTAGADVATRPVSYELPRTMPRVTEPTTVAPIAVTGGESSPAVDGGPVLPAGTGMWIWNPEETEGGDSEAIVERAVDAGLTHVYVRTGSSRRGFHGRAFLEQLVPTAHQAGLRVYGWDFPYLDDVDADVVRAMAAIEFDVAGHRIDGFVADVETALEGVAMTPAAAGAYSAGLREAAGEDYPLVVAVPRPTGRQQATYPYAEVVPHFDAVAPMLYWFHLGHDPAEDVIKSTDWLARFDKPVMPIGQVYDARHENGPPGIPPTEEIHAFIETATSLGSPAVSFWAWEHADARAWDAVATAPVGQAKDSAEEPDQP